MRIGAFISTSVFISLNSAEFCSKWIYGIESDPVLTLESYMLMWSSFQLFITAYVAFFVPEINPEINKILKNQK